MIRASIAVLCATAAGATDPVRAWPGPSRPMIDADLAFRPAPEDEYAESMTLAADFQDPRTSICVTIAASNLGLGANKAAVKSQLDAGGRVSEWSDDRDGDWSQPAPGDLRLGPTIVRGTLSRLHLWHQADRYTFDLWFTPITEAWRPGGGRTLFGDGSRFYEFALPMPLARVTGHVRVGGEWRPVAGTGYIDHSRTNLYPHDVALRWYRLRGHDDHTFVQFSQFHTPPRWGSKAVSWLYVARGGRILHESHDLDLALGDLRPDAENPSYQVAWRYAFRAGDALSGTSQADRQTWRSDYVAAMGPLRRLVVSQFARPVAVGVKGRFHADLKVPTLNGPIDGTCAMSETFVK